jgi:hypothetical protein
MEKRIDWLENELERVEAQRKAANKEAKVHMKLMIDLVAGGATFIPAKLRILSDPEKQYELHEWYSKGGDDVLLPLMIKEYQMERDYEIFVEKMDKFKDRISSYKVFKDHPDRHYEYASYLERLIETDGIDFVAKGGGRTYEEFDLFRCRQISKA